MKTLMRTISLVILMIFTLTYVDQINTYANANLSTSNRNIVNAGVLLSSFDDPFMQKSNKV